MSVSSSMPQIIASKDTMSNSSTFVNDLNIVTKDKFANDGERMKALAAVYALVARLETPWEFVARLCMGQPALGAALKVAMDMRLFELWQEKGREESTARELAWIVSCDPELLVRLLRHLAANHILEEPSIGLFKQTALSTSFLQPVFGEWIHHLYDATLPCFFKMPEYLSQTGYTNPIDPKNGVFQFAKGWKDDMFNYFESHPREGASFNHVMGGVMAQQGGWLDIFPHERLLEAAAKNPESPLLVDVGGNIGHDIERFRRAHPETANRLYLEDRPEVLQRATCGELINKEGYDFFTQQPIKGARAYYMHGVLHDWSDEPARKILEMQRDALVPGYSTLLVHDHIAPRALAHPHTTAYDLTMMVMVAGKERTEEHWRELLESTGYVVKNIWTSPLTVQGIIEAEIKV
ncbi:S-adenosyl-L-methionine-dependent methyltransferase [Astrocystis sublimbata]|nr:S-adenosyl-L-methionine-dependent methyltransferase [Astrocystis sublimbata]